MFEFFRTQMKQTSGLGDEAVGGDEELALVFTRHDHQAIEADVVDVYAVRQIAACQFLAKLHSISETGFSNDLYHCRNGFARGDRQFQRLLVRS